MPLPAPPLTLHPSQAVSIALSVRRNKPVEQALFFPSRTLLDPFSHITVPVTITANQPTTRSYEQIGVSHRKQLWPQGNQTRSPPVIYFFPLPPSLCLSFPYHILSCNLFLGRDITSARLRAACDLQTDCLEMDHPGVLLATQYSTYRYFRISSH